MFCNCTKSAINNQSIKTQRNSPHFQSHEGEFIGVIDREPHHNILKKMNFNVLLSSDKPDSIKVRRTVESKDEIKVN